MIRETLSAMVLALGMAACAGSVLALTCEECKEMERSRALLEREIVQKESALREAYDKKKFQDVADLRNRIVELSKNLLELQKKESACKDACRPDVVKETECNRLRDQIVKMEEDPAAAVDKVDALYRELANCNKDLAQLKKPR